MADTSSQAGITNWGGLLGAGAGALVNYLGNNSATGALTSAEGNAINTQTGLQGQLTGIYGGQRTLGSGADVALGAQLGLNGTPDFSAFQNSPGFQGSLALGNQAIERAASSNGSLYTPNMLNQLGQYDTTYASQNYNNYIGQLMQSAGLGASGNQGLAQGYTSSGNNISQLQQNQGNARAGGAANTSGITSNLFSQIGNGIGGLFSGSNNGSTNPNASGVGSFGAGSSDTTGGLYNGGAFGGGAPLYDSSTGGYPGASTTATGGDWFNPNP